MANKIATFSNDKTHNDIIFQILDKNGLKENWEDCFNKIKQGKNSWFNILYFLSKNYALNINDKKFFSEIQKQLGVNEITAEQILKDVKEKILPLIKIINEEEEEVVPKVLEAPNRILAKHEETKQEKKLPKKPAKDSAQNPPIQPRQKTPLGSDKYRESLQ